MNWAFRLPPKERRLVKVSDLDALESIVRAASDEVDIAMAYERIFEALDRRANSDPVNILEWGRRYIE